jgi:hypothetical protein
MNEGIQASNTALQSLISEMIEISCITIHNMYIEYKKVPPRDTCLLKVKYFHPDVVSFIIGDLFTADKKKTDILNFNDLNNKFKNFKYVFTPGYIREYVMIYYRDHKSDVCQKIESAMKSENK